MTEQLHTFNSIAPLSNVMAFMALLDKVENRGMNIPGMATFHGPAGYGKSFAANYAANSVSAVLVQCNEFWTTKSLLKAILSELRIRPAGTIADMAEQAMAELVRTGRPLLIDEADVLVRKRMIEMVRALYEGSQCSIILIGEELLPEKLKRWERVHSRMLAWVPAEPASARDVDLLVRLYCPNLDIAPDLISEMVRWSAASPRRIAVNLQLISEKAKILGRDRITMQDWGDDTFYSGATPETRRGLL